MAWSFNPRVERGCRPGWPGALSSTEPISRGKHHVERGSSCLTLCAESNFALSGQTWHRQRRRQEDDGGNERVGVAVATPCMGRDPSPSFPLSIVGVFFFWLICSFSCVSKKRNQKKDAPVNGSSGTRSFTLCNQKLILAFRQKFDGLVGYSHHSISSYILELLFKPSGHIDRILKGVHSACS